MSLQGNKGKGGKKTGQADDAENEGETEAGENEESEENQFYHHNSPPSHVKVNGCG